MNKTAIAGIIAAFTLSTSNVALAGNTLKASEAELDMLSAEADETSMQETETGTPATQEPDVTPSTNANAEALADSVARQLSGILGKADASDRKKTEDRLENMVSSELLKGADMDDLRSAVSAAMQDITRSGSENVTAEQVQHARQSLQKLVGKTEATYIRQQQEEAREYATSTREDKAAPDSGDATPPTETGHTNHKEYVTVQPGESLYKIALRVYGSGDNFVRLYEANRENIIDPNLIRAGQVLRVPR